VWAAAPVVRSASRSQRRSFAAPVVRSAGRSQRRSFPSRPVNQPCIVVAFLGSTRPAFPIPIPFPFPRPTLPTEPIIIRRSAFRTQPT
jgi:hypothetical protein